MTTETSAVEYLPDTTQILESMVERVLTEEDQMRLKQQNGRLVAPSRQVRLETEARKSWDLFYKRNETRFYKDRHWTAREFQELTGATKYNDSVDVTQTSSHTRRHTRIILEVGCGVGNFLFPILAEYSDVFFYACDFSQRAIDFVRANPLYNSERCHAFCADVTTDPLSTTVPPCSLDFATMIFVLSAIHPDKMLAALQNVYKVLKPGGALLFRDYGVNDHAMVRFSAGSKLADRFYVRQDNTRAYYFSLDQLAKLMISAGFEPSENKFILRETTNRKEKLCVERVFVQGKFIKRHLDHEILKEADIS